MISGFHKSQDVDLAGLSISDAVRALDAKQVSALELTDAALERAFATEDGHHAFAFLDADQARRQATESDARRSAGLTASRLDGIPFGVKDLFLTSDMPTRAGCHEDSPFEALRVDDQTVKSLRLTGVVLLGKHTTHHFGSGRCPSRCRNAVDSRMFAGGSSSGSGVSVALGSSFGALGTDGGGSVRIPAALNGVVGFLPSLGNMPKGEDGLVGPDSFSSPGLICRTVDDVAMTYSTLMGLGHQRISRSAARKQGPLPLQGMRMGVVGQLNRGATAEITAVVRAAMDKMEDAGATLVEGEIPELESTSGIFDVIAGYEVHRAHQNMLENHPEAYCDAILPSYLRGANISHQSYTEACVRRESLETAIDKFCRTNRINLLVGPVAGKVAVPAEGMDPLYELGFYSMFTMFVNLVGRPALTMPCGVVAGGLPVGMQVVGLRGDDIRLLDWADTIQAVLGERGLL